MQFKDVGDHPPITPTSYATYEELGGEAWRVYDFITRYFIASVFKFKKLIIKSHLSWHYFYYLKKKISPDCKYEELTITAQILNEQFTCSGKNTISNGWTELMPWKQIDTKEMPSLKQGDILQIGNVN